MRHERVRRTRHLRKHALDLVAAAARQQRDEPFARIEAMARERPFAARGRTHRIEQRMTDEHDLRIVPVDRRLERKQHGEAVDAAQDLPDAPTTPRPDLGAHVVEDRYPASLGDRGERQVEFREVDQHE